MRSNSPHATPLTRCLRLNALALAFSLSHTIADISLFAFGPGISDVVSAAIVGAASAIYGWWGWSMARAARAGHAGLASLLALCGVWAVAHGATFVFIPLTEYMADIIHFGSLILGSDKHRILLAKSGFFRSSRCRT